MCESIGFWVRDTVYLAVTVRVKVPLQYSDEKKEWFWSRELYKQSLLESLMSGRSIIEVHRCNESVLISGSNLFEERLSIYLLCLNSPEDCMLSMVWLRCTFAIVR